MRILLTLHISNTIIIILLEVAYTCVKLEIVVTGINTEKNQYGLNKKRKSVAYEFDITN